jgi:UDP-2,3-diacylglucosamine pyrophosphatase LpxH
MKEEQPQFYCKSIFISDVHLGTSGSQALALLEFLRDYESENLFLVGDIVDGWELRRKFNWAQSHSDVIQKLLRKARKGAAVYYILGNHDEFLRDFLPITLGDNVTICDEFEYTALNGKRYLIIHGDLFDAITMTKKWLALLGDKSYLFLLRLNRPINFIRKALGFNYWSLSKYAKRNVKKAVSFITDYEQVLASEAKNRKVDGVICGHIHEPQMREMFGIEYINCGDWVENCSAVIEHFDGRLEIYHKPQEIL